MNATRMCSECTREFEIEDGHIGRPPTKCPDCRKHASPAPSKRSAPADVADEKPRRRTSRTKARTTRSPRKKPAAARHANGRGSVEKILTDLRAELATLQERESHLQEAIESLERLSA